MSERKVLVTAVSGDVGCSAVRALHGQVGSLIGCDMKSYTPVDTLLDGFFEAPSVSQADEYVSFLRSVVEKKKIDFIIPISEPEIELLNARRNELEESGVCLLLNNDVIVNTFLDKLKTVQYLESIGVSVPRTVQLNEYDGLYGFPVIVKARRSCGGKGLRIAYDENDLRYFSSKDDGSFVAQECMGTDEEEYTTGVFSDGHATSSITFKRILGYGGVSAEARLVNEPFMDEMAKVIADKVALIGSINIQTRKVGSHHIPFEINPRLSSTLLFRKRFGFDDVLWWMNALSGRGYVYKIKYTSGVAMRCLGEHYVDMKGNDDYR